MNGLRILVGILLCVLFAPLIRTGLLKYYNTVDEMFKNPHLYNPEYKDKSDDDEPDDRK